MAIWMVWSVMGSYRTHLGTAMEFILLGDQSHLFSSVIFSLSLSDISIESPKNLPKRTHCNLVRFLTHLLLDACQLGEPALLQLSTSTHLGHIDAKLNLEQYWCTISRTITKVLSRKNSKSLNHTRGVIALILYFPLKKEDHCTGSQKEGNGLFKTVILLPTVIKPSVSIPPKSLLLDNAFLSKVNSLTHTNKHQVKLCIRGKVPVHVTTWLCRQRERILCRTAPPPPALLLPFVWDLLMSHFLFLCQSLFKPQRANSKGSKLFK